MTVEIRDRETGETKSEVDSNSLAVVFVGTLDNFDAVGSVAPALSGEGAIVVATIFVAGAYTIAYAAWTISDSGSPLRAAYAATEWYV
jgi:hypothetical protein